MKTYKEIMELADAASTEMLHGHYYQFKEKRQVLQQAIEELAKDAAIAFKGPAKWTDAEAEAGNMGIRWVNAEGVHGRPTECDVRQYLVSTPTARGCNCPDCRQFYAQETTAIERLQAEIDEQCKLNSMGAEREYVLLGKVESLERELAKLKQQKPIAYLAWSGDKPCWQAEDCVCEDAVFPVDSDDDRTSMPDYLLNDITKCTEVVEREILKP